MVPDRHIRCWLLATLITSAAFSAYDADAAKTPPAAIPLRPSEAVQHERIPGLAMPAAGRATSTAKPLVLAPSAGVPRPFKPFVLSQALRDSIVGIALAHLGTPYVYGGTTPQRGFDCSGLVQYAMSRVHMTVPRTALLQARVGAPIARAHLQRGDLLAFGEGEDVTHIGIYVGAGWFVHASSVAGRVILSPLDRRPSRLIRPMKAARRLLATSDASESRARSD